MDHLEVLKQLRDIATGVTSHRYNGMCPDELEGPDVRDTDCPACRALLAADAALDK